MTPDRARRKPSQAGSPRRAPTREARQRDADRSREALLNAALDEFSAHGYEGTRVADIAARAGVNTQLVSYYFGGKRGLYEALAQRWLDRESAITVRRGALEDLITAYFEASSEDPRMSRLLLWAGLEDHEHLEDTHEDPTTAADLADMKRRQDDGEIAADLDPAMLQLALMGAILTPVALPQVVRRITGRAPDDPTFRADYAEHLRRLVRRLAETAAG